MCQGGEGLEERDVPRSPKSLWPLHLCHLGDPPTGAGNALPGPRPLGGAGGKGGWRDAGATLTSLAITGGCDLGHGVPELKFTLVLNAEGKGWAWAGVEDQRSKVDVFLGRDRVPGGRWRMGGGQTVCVCTCANTRHLAKTDLALSLMGMQAMTSPSLLTCMSITWHLSRGCSLMAISRSARNVMETAWALSPGKREECEGEMEKKLDMLTPSKVSRLKLHVVVGGVGGGVQGALGTCIPLNSSLHT